MARGSFKINEKEIDRLQSIMKQFPQKSEQAINDVLHNKAGDILQLAIKGLIPVSGRMWKGKKAGAKSADSLQNVTKENLAITVTTKKAYQYLYFPDDGTNTRRHIGNKQFFRRGGESKQSEIVDKCINKITESMKE